MRFFIDAIFLASYLILGIPVLLVLHLIGKVKKWSYKSDLIALRLGSEARMNVPGVLGANWAWRFEEKDLQEWHATELKKMTQLFNR